MSTATINVTGLPNFIDADRVRQELSSLADQHGASVTNVESVGFRQGSFRVTATVPDHTSSDDIRRALAPLASRHGASLGVITVQRTAPAAYQEDDQEDDHGYRQADAAQPTAAQEERYRPASVSLMVPTSATSATVLRAVADLAENLQARSVSIDQDED